MVTLSYKVKLQRDFLATLFIEIEVYFLNFHLWATKIRAAFYRKSCHVPILYSNDRYFSTEFE